MGDVESDNGGAATDGIGLVERGIINESSGVEYNDDGDDDDDGVGDAMVFNWERGLGCGGDRDIEARCLSSRRCLRLSISASSSAALVRLSSEACLASATADTCLDLPRRCEGGNGF